MRCVNLIISRPERHTHDGNVAEKSGIPETIDWALNLKRAVFGNPQCAAFSDQGYPATALDIAGWFTAVLGSTKLITIDTQQ